MLNRSGVEIVDAGAPAQILANATHFCSVGCQVRQDVGVEQADGKLIAFAGFPVIFDASDMTNPAEPSGRPEPAEWMFAIEIAFAADETITVDGTTYTCKATENVESKQFAGATAAAQAASLLKMLESDNFTFGAGAPDSAEIIITQAEPDAAGNNPAVSATSTTGSLLQLHKIRDYSEVPGNAVLLHDVDVTAGDANGTLLISGIVNFNRLSPAAQEKVHCDVNAFGNVTILAL